MKKIIAIMILSLSINAGFYTSEYFEPVAGCGVGGAVGYMAGGDNQMKNAALFCAGGALIMYGIYSYYDNKYSKPFESALSFEKQELRKNEMKKRQGNILVDNPFVERVTKVLPAKKLSTGDIMLPRVQEDIKLKDTGDLLGR